MGAHGSDSRYDRGFERSCGLSARCPPPAIDSTARVALLITIETTHSGRTLARLIRIQCMRGVVSAVLVSEHSQLAAADEEILHEQQRHSP
jgi:hypothetical protein